MGSSSSRLLALTKQQQKDAIKMKVNLKSGTVNAAKTRRKISLFERFSNAYEIWSIRRKNAELEKEIESVQEMKKKLLEKHDQDSMLIRTQYENRKLAALHCVKMNAKESAIPSGRSSVSYNQSVSSVFASPGSVKQEELLKTTITGNLIEIGKSV